MYLSVPGTEPRSSVLLGEYVTTMADTYLLRLYNFITSLKENFNQCHCWATCVDHSSMYKYTSGKLSEM